MYFFLCALCDDPTRNLIVGSRPNRFYCLIADTCMQLLSAKTMAEIT